MSVNAVGQNDNKAKPVGTAAAVVGSTVGLSEYYINAKRPDLEAVFKMRPDEFTRMTQNASEELKADVEAVKNAKDGYAKTLQEAESKYGEAVKNRAMYIDSLELNKDDLKSINNKIADAKAAVAGKQVKSLMCKPGELEFGGNYFYYDNCVSEARKKVSSAKKRLALAKEALEKADDSAKVAAEAKLKQAQEDLDICLKHRNEALAERKNCYKSAKAEIDSYANARRELQTAKRKAFDAKEMKDAKKAVAEAVETSKKALENVKTTKFQEVITAVENNFANIKKLFPKVKNPKLAAIWGGVAAVTAGITAYILSGNEQDRA